MLTLQPDTSFHIYNHANGFENIFLHEANYHYFLQKYKLYINPIAETYAYCLMPNHFHFVIRLRERELIKELMEWTPEGGSTTNTFSKVSNFGKGIRKRFDDDEISKYLSKQFANFFSCYTQSFNKVYQRRGSLFVKNFKRESIHDDEYLRNAIVYTHRNPVHHGFCAQFSEWPYSSYHELVDNKHELTEPQKTIGIFGGIEAMMAHHERSLEPFTQTMAKKTMEI